MASEKAEILALTSMVQALVASLRMKGLLREQDVGAMLREAEQRLRSSTGAEAEEAARVLTDSLAAAFLPQRAHEPEDDHDH